MWAAEIATSSRSPPTVYTHSVTIKRGPSLQSNNVQPRVYVQNVSFFITH